MPTIGQSGFHWFTLKSPWQQLQDWRTNQADLQSSADLTSALVTKLSNAANNQTSGAANFAARAALTRIQKAVKAKHDAQAAKAAAQAQAPKAPPSKITLSDGQVISIDPATTLAGGSKLNTKNGTLTLADGTLINIKTGLKVDTTA